jgi:hypothetical protein
MAETGLKLGWEQSPQCDDQSGNIHLANCKALYFKAIRVFPQTNLIQNMNKQIRPFHGFSSCFVPFCGKYL